ncbi:hypothetical protein U91I_04030 [alpha proteobacterium U9-1i]|nr:hypothetical protein U91I_04030 [alpha proteobacterium U9-1i]
MFGRVISLACLFAVTLGSSPLLAQEYTRVEQTDQRMTSAMRGLDDPLRAYQRGVDALFEGDYQNAVDALRIYVRQFPDDLGGNLALGVAFMGNGQYEAARPQLQRAVNQPNPPISALLQLGLANVRLNDPDEAQTQRNALARRLRRCGDSCDQYERDRIVRAIDEIDRALQGDSAAVAPAPRI